MVSWQSVNAHRVIVEERPPLGLRQALRGVFESAPDRIEAVAQAVDRPVAREHGALGAEQLDQREAHFAARRAVQIAEAGDLHAYVLASGEPGHRLAPAGELAA